MKRVHHLQKPPIQNNTPRYVSRQAGQQGIAGGKPPVGTLEDLCHLPLVCGPAKQARPGKREQGALEKLGRDLWNQQARKMACLAAQTPLTQAAPSYSAKFCSFVCLASPNLRETLPGNESVTTAKKSKKSTGNGKRRTLGPEVSPLCPAQTSRTTSPTLWPLYWDARQTACFPRLDEWAAWKRPSNIPRDKDPFPSAWSLADGTAGQLEVG